LGVQHVHGASVTLAWDPNPEADVAGYKVYYGSASGSYSLMVDVGNWTSLTISGLGAGKTYYFAATAYDTAGDESGMSSELRYDTPSPASNFLSPANGSYDTGNYTIGASAGPNGSISPSGNITVMRGFSKTFIIRPQFGYRISRVNIDGAYINYVTSHTFKQINANHTIRAEFEPIWNIYRKKMTPSN
jgi:Fibronectin type III domain